MKKLVVLAVVVFMSAGLSAQGINVPADVQKTFTKLYPNVTDVKWGKEGSDEFEAEFKMDGKSISVVIDEDGELENTETAIEVFELPKAALDFIKSNYKDFKITEAAKIVDEDGEVTYEAEVSKNIEKKDVLFDKEGKQIVNK
jgi:hypothetical protein